MSQKLFEDFNKIIIRSPSCPQKILFTDPEETKNLDELVKVFSEDKKFLESIHWSSAQLYKKILSFEQEELSAKKKNKILLSLKKYLIRTSTRSTPYGTFAGTAIHNLVENNCDEIKVQKKLRVDLNFFRKLIRSIENNIELSESLNYHVNNTVYFFNNEFRYLEVDKKQEKTIQISAVEKNEILKFIAKKNKITAQQIKDTFAEKYGTEEVTAFFEELVESGFLISELELFTGTSNLKILTDFLDKIKSEKVFPYQTLVKSIIDYISEAERSAVGQFQEFSYKNIIDQCRSLDIFMEDEQVFHVDLLNAKVNDFEISKNDLKNITEAIDALSKITKKPSEITEIQKFQKLFAEKYDTAAIPLMEVLDPETGIGFPANENIGNFSDNDFISFTPLPQTEINIKKKNITAWLTDKIENLSPQEKEIKIEIQDLRDFTSRINDLPLTFNIVGQKIGNENILLQNVSGPHANTLIARFAYMSDEIGNLCQEISEAEKEYSDEVVFAEIIWFPPGKEANVTRKPTFSEYEIPIYYEGHLSAKNKIHLNDILVSVSNNEVLLFSKTLKKRIIPRLSNAHNYRKDHNPVYRFLCSLQDQASVSFALLPDFQQDQKRFFPRISYKNIILHPASWILQQEDIQSIKNSDTPSHELKLFLKKWKTGRLVLFCQGDNELFVDTANDSYLEILLDEIKTAKNIILLKEWLYKYDHQINQFILPLKKNHHKPFRSFTSEYSQDLQSFLPGEEWFYFKVYCNANYSDLILKAIDRQMNILVKEKKIDHWFFIRYLDPHYHLRFRIKLKSNTFSGEILSTVNKIFGSFLDKKYIWKVVLDTYIRESSRYSSAEIENVEYGFYKDSRLITELLRNDEFLENPAIRVFCAIRNVDSWFDLFGFDLISKIEFCEKMKNSFAKEQSADFLQDTEKKYRENQDFLFSFLKNNKFADLFTKRNRDLEFLYLRQKNLHDFIHMSLNRFFVTHQRNWEYLVYYFCLKYYNRCYYTAR